MIRLSEGKEYVIACQCFTALNFSDPAHDLHDVNDFQHKNHLNDFIQ